ncbi:MAG: DUF2971 domain-containing protein, partial [Anaerolineae bacterium]|nr:DUF2971 domain-containing protein [Anaerolineae bacterium]
DEFSPPKEVCHYTRASTAIEKILYNREILLGNLNETNDPKETKSRVFQYINVPRDKFDVAGNVHALDYLKNIKVLCTCCHNHPFWEIMNRKNDLEDYKYGVSRSLMWAHYANRYKGVCIIFDGEALHKNIHDKILEMGGNLQEDIRCGFVMYDYDASFMPSEGNNDDVYSLMKHYEINFLRKSPEWKPEHEFRWLVVGRQNTKLLVSIEKAIKAVVVGVDFHEAYRPHLESKSKELNFRLGRIDWINGRPIVSFMN